MANNFVSYANATQLMTAIGNKFKSLTGAYIPKGNTTFELLPATITSSMLGYVYNVTNAFTSDSRFADGSGIDYPAGSNVVVVDIDTTGSTPDLKFDVLSGIIDLSNIETAIDNVAAMIAGDFDASQAYAIGDVVVYENHLYKFTSAHTASDPWDASEVADTTVNELIAAALATANSNINTAKTAVKAMVAPAFDATNAYSVDDVVTYEDGLYKFISAHTAGDPWNVSEVTDTTVDELITTKSSVDKRVTDFDTAKENGIYYFESLPNHGPSLPASHSVNGGLLIVDSQAGPIEQTTLFVENDGSNLSFKAYIRTETMADIWSNWREVSNDPESLTASQIADLEALI